MASNEKYGFLIPIYNHGKELRGVINNLQSFSLPFILVDDGSDQETKAHLQQICREHPSVDLVELPRNTGKGGAVMAGIKHAHQQNYTHVFQIDADGQHDTGCCEEFLAQSRQHPAAMICGEPVYDESVPRIRKDGRKIGNFWVQLIAMSTQIRDALCGFRIYPVAPTYAVVSKVPLIDRRMGFDPEILIRLKWKNLPFIYLPVKIHYPENGLSHYHVVRDNARLTAMFVRTFMGMMLRSPVLLGRKLAGMGGKK